MQHATCKCNMPTKLFFNRHLGRHGVGRFFCRATLHLQTGMVALLPRADVAQKELLNLGHIMIITIRLCFWIANCFAQISVQSLSNSMVTDLVSQRQWNALKVMDEWRSESSHEGSGGTGPVPFWQEINGPRSPFTGFLLSTCFFTSDVKLQYVSFHIVHNIDIFNMDQDGYINYRQKVK